jgi:uncharacterized membrane protein YcjF (UPF0283 family)
MTDPSYQRFPQPDPGQPTQSSKGFLASLFDFTFSSFVTPKIVKFVYVLASIGLGLLYLALVIGSFSQSAGLGVLSLVVGAVIFIVYLAFIRMTLEFYYAIVRMSEDLHHRLPRS